MTIAQAHNISLHRGVVEAYGMLLSPTLLGEQRMRERLLSLWTTGTQAFDWDYSIVLIFPEPRLMKCSATTGMPLVRYGSTLSSVVLMFDGDKEVRAIRDLKLVQNGKVCDIPLQELEPVDPSLWIAMSFMHVVGSPLVAKVQHVVLDKKPAPVNLRSALAGVTTEDPRREALISTLRDPSSKVAGNRKGSGGVNSVGGRKGSGGILSSVAKISGTTAFGRAIQQLLREALWKSQMGKLVGGKNARYLQEMLDMLEKGDPLEGLKRAIPLGSDGNAEDGWPALKFARSHNTLQLSMSRSASSGTIPVAEQTLALMRDSYRRASKKLEAMGDIEKAAYVLADLLCSPGEAVDLLEKHEKYEVAALLSEGRFLNPAITIRMWFLAGNTERALAVARYSGAFVGAVAMLEQKGKADEACSLRKLWSDELTESGNYTAAVDVLWVVKEERQKLLPLMDALIADGGPVGARMLAQSLTLFHTDHETRLQAAHDLLDADQHSASLRVALANAIAKSNEPGLQPLARKVVRSLLRDESELEYPVYRDTINAVLAFTGDDALRADVKVSKSSKSTTSRAVAAPVETYSEQNVGAFPISDAALLPNGRLLVALGESGCRLLADREAKAIHFHEPADALVLSDSGQRVICIANREGTVRLGILDLVAKHIRHWSVANFKYWANSFDGMVWLAATDSEVLVIDTTAKELQSLWNWRDVLKPADIVYDDHCYGFLMRSTSVGSKDELWRVEKGTLALRARSDFHELPFDQSRVFTAFTPQGSAAYLRLAIDTDGRTLGSLRIDNQLVLTLDNTIVNVLQLIAFHTTVALLIEDSDGLNLSLFDRRSPLTSPAQIHLQKAKQGGVRLSKTHAVLYDNLGRVIVFDLTMNRVVRVECVT